MSYFNSASTELMNRLRENGWEVSGGLDDVVKLEMDPGNSRLKARLRIEKNPGGHYDITGVLEGADNETILEIGYSSHQDTLVARLKRLVFGMIEPYLTGITPYPEIKETHDMYAVSPVR